MENLLKLIFLFVQIADFNELERDQIVCAASGKIFLQPKDVRETVEIKANWGRARRKYGTRATDIEVMTMPNPRVDVSTSTEYGIISHPWTYVLI